MRRFEFRKEIAKTPQTPRPVRVLFIQNTASVGDVLSGGEIRLYRIFKFLSARYSCTLKAFFSLRSMNVEFRINEAIIKRYTFYDRFSIYGAYLFKCLDLLSSLAISREEYGILYASSDFFPDVIPAFFYKKIHKTTSWVQCIFHVYPNWKARPGNKLINLIAQKLQRFSFFLIRNCADRIIVINSVTRDQLIKMGFQENIVQLSPCGVDIDYLDAIEPNERKYDGIFLSRLNPTKGIFDLVEIWKFVCGRFQDAKLGIIGGGSPSVIRELRNKIAVAGMGNNIDILGHQKRDDAFSLLKAAKVFLFPSHEEGWSIAIAEAMACQVPVVAWALPVYAEIFGDQISGVSENNLDAFVGKVIGFMSDADLRRKRGDSGANFVRRYSWENAAQQDEKIVMGVFKE